jgi:hypothetical protein
VAAAVFYVDGPAAAKALLGLSDARALKLSIVKPVIPLSALDFSNAGLAATVLLLGFFPALFALCYASFRRPYSRLFLSGMVLIAAVCLWTHFYFTRAYNALETPRSYLMDNRLYICGEPEELLVKDPRKALRANPELLNSGNEDLNEFLEKHFPEGMKGSGK